MRNQDLVVKSILVDPGRSRVDPEHVAVDRPISPFDYSDMPAALVPEAKTTAERVRDLVRRQYDNVVETGRALLAVKERLEHGLFVAWVDGACGMSVRSAQRYMSVASLPADKHDTVSLLPPAVQYKLAAPSTPTEVRDELLEKVAAGKLEPTSVPFALQTRIEEIRDAERGQKLTPDQREKEAERRKREVLKKEHLRAEMAATELERDVLHPYRQAQAAKAADMLVAAFDHEQLRYLQWLLASSQTDARYLIPTKLSGYLRRPEKYEEPEKIPLVLIFPKRLSARPEEWQVKELEHQHSHRPEMVPILVEPVRRSIKGVETDCFELVAGRNRLEAAKRLGWEMIDAFVVETGVAPT